jgi:spectinomycin phosphotransferase
LRVSRIAFLPLGADVNTAVYRVVAEDATPYFLKLRRGVFDEASVAIPHFLRSRGITQVIAPLETAAGQLRTRLEAYTMVLYPFVEGQDGYEAALPDRGWVDLGVALRGLHTAALPDTLGETIQHETYTSYWRDRVRMFQARVEDTEYADPVAAELAAFLAEKRAVISDLVDRTERLGDRLRAQTPEHVLCHGDMHPGNLLITGDALYVVDWDTLIFAPKEHDLGFVGGVGQSSHQEALFYQGYGPAQADPAALAYYRYERIVRDTAEFSAQLLLTDAGGEDRAQSLHYLTESFLPDQEVETAYRLDRLAWD